ncbi:MAG: PqqD family protein [Candidatus Sericytochromatia bacterium]|nr:PqqD family protein [Candidatus Sericytochromatia bacterium]
MADPLGAPLGALTPPPALNPRIAARVVNGETLILTPHDSVLHTLNGVATRVWELLRKASTLGEVGATLAAEYEVAPDEALADVVDLVAAMQAAGILEGPDQG